MTTELFAFDKVIIKYLQRMGKRKRLHIISVSEVQQQPIEVEHPSEKNLSDQSNLIHCFLYVVSYVFYK